MRKPTIAVLFLALFFTACVKKQPEGPVFPFPQAPEYVEKERTEPWPEDVDPEITLRPEELVSLQSLGDIDFVYGEAGHKAVQDQFMFYVRKYPGTVPKWIKRAELYLPYAMKILKERGLPEDLAYLPFIESGFNPEAISRAGALGCWQFMPRTGKLFGLEADWWLDERRDPYKATQAACDYLTMLYGMFNDWTLAVAAYNAGEARILKIVKETNANNFFDILAMNDDLPDKLRLKEETLKYVPRFIAMGKIIRKHEALGYGPMQMDKAPELVEVEVEPGTDLVALADAASADWEIFKSQNACFNRFITPPDKNCIVYVPDEKLEDVKKFLESPESRPYAGYCVYTIKKGDTWSHIGSKYNIPVTELKKVNKQKSNKLKPGQTVMIPKTGKMVAGAEGSKEAKHGLMLPPRAIKTASGDTVKDNRTYYVVQQGDTLGGLAEHFGIDSKTLQSVNQLSSPKSLRAGQKLIIPDKEIVQASAKTEKPKKSEKPKPELPPGVEAKSYTVKPGDTVWTIASQFDVKPDDVLKWNNLRKRSVLHPGDTLHILVD